MKKLMTICGAIVLFCSGYAMAGTWTTIDMPGEEDTQPYGISGSNIVGRYYGPSGHGSFLYSGTTWTTLDMPGTDPGTYSTRVSNIDGSNIVGAYYGDDHSGYLHGFIYNGTTWATLDKPGAIQTIITGIDGSNIVGDYVDNAHMTHGFLYNGTTWITLDAPGATETHILDISGSNIIVWGSDTPETFLYNGITWTPLSFIPVVYNPIPRGIDGSNIVGQYLNHGFLYDGTTCTTIDKPGATDTEIHGIDGIYLVGSYYDGMSSHGFIYTVPEPASAAIMILGATLIATKRRR
jgi:hypothetical protein